jgi:hypothetical protein
VVGDHRTDPRLIGDILEMRAIDAAIAVERHASGACAPEREKSEREGYQAHGGDLLVPPFGQGDTGLDPLPLCPTGYFWGVSVAAVEAWPEATVACVSKVYPMRSHTVSAERGAAAVVGEADAARLTGPPGRG